MYLLNLLNARVVFSKHCFLLLVLAATVVVVVAAAAAVERTD